MSSSEVLIVWAYCMGRSHFAPHFQASSFPCNFSACMASFVHRILPTSTFVHVDHQDNNFTIFGQRLRITEADAKAIVHQIDDFPGGGYFIPCI